MSPNTDDEVAVDEAIDALYAEPLARFIEARNDLSKRLRRVGRKDEANAVKKLSKPSVAVWLVNRWARQHPAAIERLLGAIETLRALQTGPKIDRAQLAQARSEERAALDALVALPSPDPISGREGAAISPAILDRAVKTARAAAASEDHHAGLRAGRLDREVIDMGFIDLATRVTPIDAETLQARRMATERAKPKAKPPEPLPAPKVRTKTRSVAPPPPPVPEPPPPEPPGSQSEEPATATAKSEPPPAPEHASTARKPSRPPSSTPNRIGKQDERIHRVREAEKARSAALTAEIDALSQQVSALEAEVDAHAAALADAKARLGATRTRLDAAQRAKDRDGSVT